MKVRARIHMRTKKLRWQSLCILDFFGNRLLKLGTWARVPARKVIMCVSFCSVKHGGNVTVFWMPYQSFIHLAPGMSISDSMALDWGASWHPWISCYAFWLWPILRRLQTVPLCMVHSFWVWLQQKAWEAVWPKVTIHMLDKLATLC